MITLKSSMVKLSRLHHKRSWHNFGSFCALMLSTSDLITQSCIKVINLKKKKNCTRDWHKGYYTSNKISLMYNNCLHFNKISTQYYDFTLFTYNWLSKVMSKVGIEVIIYILKQYNKLTSPLWTSLNNIVSCDLMVWTFD